MDFELEYKLQQFREAQSGYYDANGKRFSATPLGDESAELMLELINELEALAIKQSKSTEKALGLNHVSGLLLPDNVSVKDLKMVRTYFMQHSKTIKEREACSTMHHLIEHLESITSDR